MKKIVLAFLLAIIPFVIYAETCNTDKISINSISIENITENATELDEPIANGKSINVNLGMSQVGDNARYKIVIQNDSDDDYEFDKTSINIAADYINYRLESEDDSSIIKGNSSKTFYLVAEYKNEVPTEAFQLGKYNDNKVLTVNLSTGSELINPKTGVKSYTLILSFIIIVSSAIYLALNKKGYASLMVIIIGSMIILPISVHAICKCELKLESNVEIKQEFGKRCYGDIIIENIEGESRFFTQDDYKYVPIYERERFEGDIIGWSVILSNKNNTGAIESEICSYVNDIPITSTTEMYYFSKASSVNLSNFNTSHVTDMSKMFMGSSMTSVDLSGLDTSHVTDMTMMFESSNLTSVDLSNFKTYNVEDMTMMFYNTNMEQIDLSPLNTKKLKDMGGMFAESKFTSIDLSTFNTSNVTDMNSLFDNTIATNINISNLDTRNVTDMNTMFSNTKVSTLNLNEIPNFKTSNVTNMKNMFNGAAATSINVSAFDTSKVTRMDGMFSTTNVTELDVTNFDTSNVTTISSMFADTKVSVLDLSSFDISKVESSSWLFKGSTATTGYAKNQESADFFNHTTNLPNGLRFVVK